MMEWRILFGNIIVERWKVKLFCKYVGGGLLVDNESN